MLQRYWLFALTGHWGDGTYGPLLAVLTKGGRVLAGHGSLSPQWTAEHAGVSQVGDAG